MSAIEAYLLRGDPRPRAQQLRSPRSCWLLIPWRIRGHDCRTSREPGSFHGQNLDVSLAAEDLDTDVVRMPGEQQVQLGVGD